MLATLTTFFPRRHSERKEGRLYQQADLRNSVYNELNGDLTVKTDNALDLAAFIVLQAVTVFLDRASHPDLEIFRIFEEAIGLLVSNMSRAVMHGGAECVLLTGSAVGEDDVEHETVPDPDLYGHVGRRDGR